MDILDKLKNREEIYCPIRRNKDINLRFNLYDAFLAKKRFERFAPFFMEAFDEIDGPCSVSYTHLTLPTNREV